MKTQKKTDISIILENKFIKEGLKSSAGAFITFKHIPHINNQLISKNPRHTFAQIMDLFYKDKNTFIPNHKTTSPIQLSASIDPTATIGHFTSIGPKSTIKSHTKIMNNVYIGAKVSIGSNCIIYPNTTILDDTLIGDNCIIQSGTVIGSDGFSYGKDGNSYKKIKHIGKVILEDNVEIGANTCIDRSCLTDTVIKKGSKLDNLIHVAHNCSIGTNTAIAAQVGMTGGTTIKNNVMIGGQAAIDNSVIEDDVIILARSGVTKMIKKGSIVSGFPAKNHKDELKILSKLNKLIKKDIK